MKTLCSIYFTLNFILILGFSFAAENSLYEKNAPFWQLNSSNFNATVFGKNTAFVIEFYNQWCGHCIRYAPTWLKFAEGIKTWRGVIDVAAINCADHANIGLCRDYEIDGFPAIKIFRHNLKQGDKGTLIKNRDISSLENAVIDFLQSNWNSKGEANWPNLEPLRDANLEIITEYKKSVILFIEHSDSYIGRKVILDISPIKTILIRRVTTSNAELLKSLKTAIENASIPAVIQIYRHNREKILFSFSKFDNETAIRNKVFEHFFGHTMSMHTTTTVAPVKNVTVIENEKVYLVDLENALHYSLTQEVGITHDIYGEKLDALKEYLLALKNYFPGSISTQAYIGKLYGWIVNQSDNLTGERFLSGMKSLKNDEEYLPEMRDWVGCKGSTEKYRGYPCSLWMLFHTLTVRNYNYHEAVNDTIQYGMPNILHTIWKYVIHFFTCHECSENFNKVAKKSLNEVKSPKDAILWLWEAHNKVNLRLAGDETEDPSHPKIQFPSKAICPKCRVQTSPPEKDIQWDKTEVLNFLEHFYDSNIDRSLEHFPYGGIKDPQISRVENIISPTEHLLKLLLFSSLPFFKW